MKIEQYRDYLKQYLNWRKNYKDLDKTTGKGISRKKHTGQWTEERCILGSPEEVLDKLSLNVAGIRAGNTSMELRNETVDLLDYLYKFEHITKKTFIDFMKAIKL